MFTKFVILDIKFRVTCGQSDLYQNTVKFQDIMTRIVRVFQSVSYLYFILTYFNISISRSQLLCKKNVWKNFANFTKKVFAGVPFNQVPGLGLTTVLKRTNMTYSKS